MCVCVLGGAVGAKSWNRRGAGALRPQPVWHAVLGRGDVGIKAQDSQHSRQALPLSAPAALTMFQTAPRCAPHSPRGWMWRIGASRVRSRGGRSGLQMEMSPGSLPWQEEDKEMLGVSFSGCLAH